MVVTPEFREAISAGNTRLVRIMLKDSITIDPSFSKFDELSDYASARLHDLYDEHDGEVFPADVSACTVDLLDEQMVSLIYNFSKERVNFLRKICAVLYPEKSPATPNSTESNHSPVENHLAKKHIGAGVAVAGGIVAAAGIVTSETAIIVAGAAAVLVGGALILSDIKSKE